MDLNLLRLSRPLVAQHLKADFAAFVKAAWSTLHPGTKLSWTPGHDAICDYLVAVWEKIITRLIINCPPRFAKTTILNCFLVWIWLQDPTRSFLCCSYEIDLALNGNADRRRLMESKWFKELFGDAVQLSTDRSQAGDFSNTAGGTMQAASTNSKAQGRGGSVICVDDPNSADFIYSESFRRETNFWLTNQLPQRLDNPSESAIVLVQQRLHQDDCTGHLLAQEESDWTLLKLPLIAEQDEEIRFPHSGRVWKRRKGDCLDPKRWSARTIRQRQQNRLVWAGQFQQEPQAISGNIIKIESCLYFGGKDPRTGVPDLALPDHFDRKIISVDCSFKDRSTSDYVAILTIGVLGSRRYVLNITNARLDLTGTINEIRNAHAFFGPVGATLVEDAANGPAVVAALRDEISGLIAVKPEGGKVARLVAASPEFEAGNWIFDRNHHWTYKLIEQLVLVPNAKHDDLADALSQASIYLQSSRVDDSEAPIVSWLKKQAAKLGWTSPNSPGRQPTTQPVIHPPGRSTPAPPPAEPCPVCGRPCSIRIGGSGGPYRCVQDGTQFLRGGQITTMSAPIGGCNCEKPRMEARRSIPGGVWKCDDCSFQSDATNGGRWPVNGMSRADYARGAGRRGRCG